DRGAMALFLYGRAQARARLGDYRGAIADLETAVQQAKGAMEHAEYGRILQGLALQYGYVGELKKSLDTWLRLAREMDTQGTRGYLFNSYRNIGQLHASLGDFGQAEVYVNRNNALLNEARGWNTFVGFRRAWWQGDVERGRANVFEARGQLKEA